MKFTPSTTIRYLLLQNIASGAWKVIFSPAQSAISRNLIKENMKYVKAQQRDSQ